MSKRLFHSYFFVDQENEENGTSTRKRGRGAAKKGEESEEEESPAMKKGRSTRATGNVKTDNQPSEVRIFKVIL